jgi:6-phosphogluconolactonase (cycloisomerase 2 family)
MKMKAWARLLLAVAPVLSGCKGFWDVPSGSGGSGGGNGNASGVFYVLNQQTAQLAGFSFASGSTSLTAVTNSPYALGAAPFSIAMSPGGGFLYVSTAVGIYAYGVNSSTGVLTVLNGGNVLSSDPAFTMAVDPTSTWLVEAVSGVNAVNAIPLDSTTGILPTGGASEKSVTLPSGATAVQQLTMTRTGAANPYVFVAMGTSGIAVIPFTASSTSGDPFGAVQTFSPKNTPTGADTTIAVDVTNPVLYVGETVALSGNNPGGLRMFNIGANSALTEVTGSPYATGGIGPSAILPTTHYVYVANKAVSGSNTGNITAFAITTTGTATSLTAVSSGTISAGVSTVGLAEDGTGTYVLAVNSSGNPDLNAYTISSTGALTAYATGATGTDPVTAVAIAAP